MRKSRTVITNRSPRFLEAILFAVSAWALVAGASPAQAAPETYAIDPAHSAAGFTIRHLFSHVPGRFTKLDGTIVADRDDWAKSSVQVTIDAASIDTNEPARDKHLRSDAFFDVAKFPKITFKSTSVKQLAPTRLQVSGDLTIRGVTKPVVLDVDVLGFGPGYGGGFRSGFEGRTKINRQDFGVAWNDLVEGGGAVLGDEVEITLNIDAMKQQPKPATTPAPTPAPKKGR